MKASAAADLFGEEGDSTNIVQDAVRLAVSKRMETFSIDIISIIAAYAQVR